MDRVQERKKEYEDILNIMEKNNVETDTSTEIVLLLRLIAMQNEEIIGELENFRDEAARRQ